MQYKTSIQATYLIKKENKWRHAPASKCKLKIVFNIILSRFSLFWLFVQITAHSLSLVLSKTLLKNFCNIAIQ